MPRNNKRNGFFGPRTVSILKALALIALGFVLSSTFFQKARISHSSNAHRSVSCRTCADFSDREAAMHCLKICTGKVEEVHQVESPAAVAAAAPRTTPSQPQAPQPAQPEVIVVNNCSSGNNIGQQQPDQQSARAMPDKCRVCFDIRDRKLSSNCFNSCGGHSQLTPQEALDPLPPYTGDYGCLTQVLGQHAQMNPGRLDSLVEEFKGYSAMKKNCHPTCRRSPIVIDIPNPDSLTTGKPFKVQLLKDSTKEARPGENEHWIHVQIIGPQLLGFFMHYTYQPIAEEIKLLVPGQYRLFAWRVHQGLPSSAKAYGLQHAFTPIPIRPYPIEFNVKINPNFAAGSSACPSVPESDAFPFDLPLCDYAKHNVSNGAWIYRDTKDEERSLFPFRQSDVSHHDDQYPRGNGWKLNYYWRPIDCKLRSTATGKERAAMFNNDQKHLFAFGDSTMLQATANIFLPTVQSKQFNFMANEGGLKPIVETNHRRVWPAHKFVNDDKVLPLCNGQRDLGKISIIINSGLHDMGYTWDVWVDHIHNALSLLTKRCKGARDFIWRTTVPVNKLIWEGMDAYHGIINNMRVMQMNKRVKQMVKEEFPMVKIYDDFFYMLPRIDAFNDYIHGNIELQVNVGNTIDNFFLNGDR